MTMNVTLDRTPIPIDREVFARSLSSRWCATAPPCGMP